jgi:tight adherence protein C
VIYVSLFCSITLLIYALFMLQHERREKVRRRIATFVDGKPEAENEDTEEKQEEGTPSVLRRLFMFLWKSFKRSFKRRMPGRKEEKIELKLLQAGRPFNLTPVDFRLLQICLIILFPIASTGYGMLLNYSTGSLFLLAAVGVALALILPQYYLSQRIKQRSKKAVKELPDILDLLTVSLEAGLGFDSALSKLISKKEGILAGEFHRCLEEIRLGKTRREALLGVKERIVADELHSLISSILQAEKLGIGMVQVLRVQSQEVREQRKQRAEEQAMKAPVKMMFPLVLFIFPCLFIILLGPAAIQFIDTFSK